MHKKALLIIAISMSACASLPDLPEVVQYGVHANVKPPGFYGINSKTKVRSFRKFNDPVMKAGQCLSASDYQKMQNWVKQVEQIAKEKCQK